MNGVKQLELSDEGEKQQQQQLSRTRQIEQTKSEISKTEVNGRQKMQKVKTKSLRVRTLIKLT